MEKPSTHRIKLLGLSAALVGAVLVGCAPKDQQSRVIRIEDKAPGAAVTEAKAGGVRIRQEGDQVFLAANNPTRTGRAEDIIVELCDARSRKPVEDPNKRFLRVNHPSCVNPEVLARLKALRG